MTRRCPRADSCGLVVLLLATLSACGPLRLLRPRVLEQLTPPVVDLVDYLPNVDEPNKAVLARLFATGGLTKARVHPDGVMRAAMRIRRDQLIYEPSIIVMPRAGELEVALRNEDETVHLIFLPSNGERQVLVLQQHKGGTARLRLDQPGVYTFACPVSNHAGRGELGIILVEGETPADARLDRPRQRRPGRRGR
jgi:PQQ system protein